MNSSSKFTVDCLLDNKLPNATNSPALNKLSMKNELTIDQQFHHHLADYPAGKIISETTGEPEDKLNQLNNQESSLRTCHNDLNWAKSPLGSVSSEYLRRLTFEKHPCFSNTSAGGNFENERVNKDNNVPLPSFSSQPLNFAANGLAASNPFYYFCYLNYLMFQHTATAAAASKGNEDGGGENNNLKKGRNDIGIKNHSNTEGGGSSCLTTNSELEINSPRGSEYLFNYPAPYSWNESKKTNKFSDFSTKSGQVSAIFTPENDRKSDISSNSPSSSKTSSKSSSSLELPPIHYRARVDQEGGDDGKRGEQQMILNENHHYTMLGGGGQEENSILNPEEQMVNMELHNLNNVLTQHWLKLSFPRHWPAWIYCTRYSDRPSAGPRVRKARQQHNQVPSSQLSTNNNFNCSRSITPENLNFKKSKDSIIIAESEFQELLDENTMTGIEKKMVDDKRPRTAFTNEQLARLKREFLENRYLTEQRRQNLAQDLGLNESQIKIWFQNKRAKIKKALNASILNSMPLSTTIASYIPEYEKQSLLYAASNNLKKNISS